MARFLLGALVFVMSFPAGAHLGCRDLLSFERTYGKIHSHNIALVSISSYVTGYVSAMAVLGDELAASINEGIGQESVQWVTEGVSRTKFQTYRSLFLAPERGASLYNEDNYKLAAARVIELCRTDPNNTVINLLEEKVIAELIQ